MVTLQSLFVSSIFILGSKVLSSIKFGGRVRASLVPTCKIICLGLCGKTGLTLV